MFRDIFTKINASSTSSAALMRVNHTGEVCAQALYKGQALATQDVALRRHLLEAAREEQLHLDWCAGRLRELDSHRSVLNPLWGLGSFALGVVAGLAGKKWGLGFIMETEAQVGKHLESHLTKLNNSDTMSQAIVARMLTDELQHRDTAKALGGAELPPAIKRLMQVSAKVMTTVASKI